jgi:hypothetical protein
MCGKQKIIAKNTLSKHGPITTSFLIPTIMPQSMKKNLHYMGIIFSGFKPKND